MSFKIFLIEEKKKSSMDTTIDGLTIEFSKVSSYLYANIKHISSGKFVKKFNNQPIEGGKKKFIEFVNKSDLSKIDWTKSEKELVSDEKKINNIVTGLRYP